MKHIYGIYLFDYTDKSCTKITTLAANKDTTFASSFKRTRVNYYSFIDKRLVKKKKGNDAYTRHKVISKTILF